MALEEVGRTFRGYTIFREPNEVGGHRYWSDEVGGGVVAWDTSLVSTETLAACVAIETGGDETVAAKDVLAQLADPNAVHQMMLRGVIALPSVAQIRHVYGDRLASAETAYDTKARLGLIPGAE